jgi:hypothetical protein
VLRTAVIWYCRKFEDIAVRANGSRVRPFLSSKFVRLQGTSAMKSRR